MLAGTGGLKNSPDMVKGIGTAQPQGWGKWLGFPSPGAVL